MQPYEEKYKDVNFAADEKVRYRKKKRSDSSKAKARSNHKHIKKACLLICNTKHVYYANYCIICGKIINWEIPMEKESGYYRKHSREEIFERYNGLECKEIIDIFDMYIPIS